MALTIWAAAPTRLAMGLPPGVPASSVSALRWIRLAAISTPASPARVFRAELPCAFTILSIFDQPPSAISALPLAMAPPALPGLVWVTARCASVRPNSLAETEPFITPAAPP